MYYQELYQALSQSSHSPPLPAQDMEDSLVITAAIERALATYQRLFASTSPEEEGCSDRAAPS